MLGKNSHSMSLAPHSVQYAIVHRDAAQVDEFGAWQSEDGIPGSGIRGHEGTAIIFDLAVSLQMY